MATLLTASTAVWTTRRNRRAGLVTVVVAAVLMGGCGADGGGEPSPTQPDSSPSTSTPAPATPSPGGTTSPGPAPSQTDATPTPLPAGVPDAVSDIATGLAAPWGVDFLPDGRALVTLRDEARVVLMDPDVAAADRIVPVAADGDGGAVAGVAPRGEAGLLGIAVSPKFADDAQVFIYYSGDHDNRVVAFKFTDGAAPTLGDRRDVLTGIPVAQVHNGGQLKFGPDGFLYISTGDARERGSSQQRDSLSGKILRVTLDGDPAPGNPTADSPVWTWGHRNVQGMGWDEAGQMFASEFGQNEYDELNLIVAGENYGWPDVEGMNGGKFTNPLLTWRPAQASPSGIAVTRDAIYLAALRGQRLWRVPIDPGAADPVVGEPKAYFEGEYGRLRSVVVAPDGSLWVLTNNTDGRGQPKQGDDRILRVTLK